MDLIEFTKKHGQAWEGFFVRSDMGRDFFSMIETLRPKRLPGQEGNANIALEYVAKDEQHRAMVDALNGIRGVGAAQEPLETTFQGAGYEESVENLKKQTETKSNG